MDIESVLGELDDSSCEADKPTILEELNQIGECGLLHDIGKMKIPLEILNKEGRLIK